MRDHTIPSEVRLSLYLSARFLQELELALQLIGVPSVYVRPGIEGINFPRLFVGFTGDGLEASKDADGITEQVEQVDQPPEKTDGIAVVLDSFICAVPLPLHGQPRSRPVSEVEWWFMWWTDLLTPICTATDMSRAAQVIAEQLYEESA